MTTLNTLLKSVQDFIYSTYGLITIWVIGIIVGALVLYKLGGFWAAHRGRKFRKRGKRAEKLAARLLKKKGYTILEKEPTIESNLEIAGTNRAFKITPDFLVSKEGLDYTVEVKSHGDWTLINQAGVRRQLVEYIYAAQLPCILLTTRDKKLTHVTFPKSFTEK